MFRICYLNQNMFACDLKKYLHIHIEDILVQGSPIVGRIWPEYRAVAIQKLCYNVVKVIFIPIHGAWFSSIDFIGCGILSQEMFKNYPDSSYWILLNIMELRQELSDVSVT